MDKLKEKSVVIGGCAKNVGKYIPDVFENIKKICKLFGKYKIIIYENDSTDNTLQQLMQLKNNISYYYHGDPARNNFFWEYPTTMRLQNTSWDVHDVHDYCNNNTYVDTNDRNIKSYICNGHSKQKLNGDNNFNPDDITIISETNVNQKYHGRTVVLAHARNVIVNTVLEKYDDYNYFINLDLDDVCSNPINLDNFISIFDIQEWDAITFNREGYYDIWALRHKSCTNCWNHPENINYVIEKRKEIIDLLNKSNLVHVYSAGNGFVLYKINKIKNCSYDGINKEEPRLISLDCEHVNFHKEMIEKNNANIYISSLKLF